MIATGDSATEGAPVARKVNYQRVGQVRVDRLDHVWFRLHLGGYKCCLCGAVTNEPPPAPTPADWFPEEYWPLTDKDRTLCPAEVNNGK